MRFVTGVDRRVAADGRQVSGSDLTGALVSMAMNAKTWVLVVGALAALLAALATVVPFFWGRSRVVECVLWVTFWVLVASAASLVVLAIDGLRTHCVDAPYLRKLGNDLLADYLDQWNNPAIKAVFGTFGLALPRVGDSMRHFCELCDLLIRGRVREARRRFGSGGMLWMVKRYRHWRYKGVT